MLGHYLESSSGGANGEGLRTGMEVVAKVRRMQVIQVRKAISLK